MSTAVRRQSVDTRGINLRRQSIDPRGGNKRGSMDGARAAMIVTSAQSRLPHQGARMENTYRLEPEETFPSSPVKKIIKSVFEEMLEGKEYDAAESTLLSSKLADVIKQRVKELGHSRYKIVVVVALGPDKKSSVEFTSRCVWNPKIDRYAENSFKNGKIYAVGLVYGVYLE